MGQIRHPNVDTVTHHQIPFGFDFLFLENGTSQNCFFVFWSNWKHMHRNKLFIERNQLHWGIIFQKCILVSISFETKNITLCLLYTRHELFWFPWYKSHNNDVKELKESIIITVVFLIGKRVNYYFFLREKKSHQSIIKYKKAWQISAPKSTVLIFVSFKGRFSNQVFFFIIIYWHIYINVYI